MPAAKACYNLTINTEGQKPLKGKACLDKHGNFVINTPLLKGGLMLSEGGKLLRIEAVSGPVGASGSLWRDMPPGLHGEDAGDGADEEGEETYVDDKVSKKEIFIGGY